jgi:hypothetical protein
LRKPLREGAAFLSYVMIYVPFVVARSAPDEIGQQLVLSPSKESNLRLNAFKPCIYVSVFNPC